MNNDPHDSLEQQLSAMRRPNAPSNLRAPVLAAVHRELAGRRWERRIGRLAAAVLALGIGLNWALGWRDRDWLPTRSEVASHPSSDSILEVAVAIGQATDAETGSRMAKQLAALSGAALSHEQAAAIDQEIQRRVKSDHANRKENPS